MTFRIRRLARAEWPLLRALRLAALRDSPDQFGEASAHALERSELEWADLIGSVVPPSPLGTYIAELDHAAVGMVFAFPDSSDVALGRLGGMWVAPHARGRGIGLALVESVADWAACLGMHTVRLWVVPNTPAERLYRRAKFTLTGRTKPFPGDESRAVHELQREL